MTTLPENARLAVLIDADNTSAKRAAALLEEITKYGTATVRRAYGDWTNEHTAKWKKQLNQHAIQPIQQFAYTTGKNATDFALVIDAMDLLYAGKPRRLRAGLQRQRLHPPGHPAPRVRQDRAGHG